MGESCWSGGWSHCCSQTLYHTVKWRQLVQVMMIVFLQIKLQRSDKHLQSEGGQTQICVIWAFRSLSLWWTIMFLGTGNCWHTLQEWVLTGNNLTGGTTSNQMRRLIQWSGLKLFQKVKLCLLIMLSCFRFFERENTQITTRQKPD